MFTNLGVNFSNSILNKKFNKIRVENPCVTGFNKHAYVTNFVINSINYQLSFFTRNINSQLIGFGTNMSKQELDIYMIFDDATVLTGENLAILSWVTAPAFSTQNDSFLTYFHNLNLVPTNTNAAANFYTKPFNFPDLTAPFLSIIQNNEARNLSNVIFFSFWK